MTTATHHDLISPRIDERLRRGQLTEEQVDDFRDFLDRVDRDLLHHRIITDNAYTRWFRDGEGDGCRAGPLRPPVFGVLESVPGGGLLRVINAPTLQQARSAKEILMNELGVIYRRTDAEARPRCRTVDEESKDREGDPDLVSTEGTVDGGLFRFRAAHFEWLLAVGETLGLGFDDLGKRRHGRPYVLRFCDELQRLFGSEDDQIAEGASFAVENWAAAGFWQELEDGLLQIKATRLPALKVAFFTWHNRVEAQHAGHTMEELEEVFFAPRFDEIAVLPGRPRSPRRHRHVLGRSGRRPASGRALIDRPSRSHGLPAAGARESEATAWPMTPWRSSASTTCGCSWAMRGSPPIFIAMRSASR